MTTTIPNPLGSKSNACTLVSTLDLTRQYGVWYSLAGETRVGMIVRGTNKWGVDHTEVEISGAARTELSMPVTNDDHNYPSIGVSYNNDDTPRRLYVLANMHGGASGDEGDLKIIRTTTTDGSISSWEATTLPGVGTGDLTPEEWTYPEFCQHQNGDLTLMLRVNISGNGDYFMWKLPKGSDTWGDPVMIFQGRIAPDGDDANRSCYFSPPWYDINLNLWCISGVWRDNTNAGAYIGNYSPFVIYSIDELVTPKTPNGNPLSWPILEATRDSHPDMALPDELTGGETEAEGFLNWGGMVTDWNGIPHVIGSRNPAYHWVRSAPFSDEGTWTQTQVGPDKPAGITLNGVAVLDVANVIALQGHIWWLSSGQMGSPARGPLMWRLDSVNTADRTIPMGHIANYSGGLAHWGVNYDRVAIRFGLVEVLTPSGDVPLKIGYAERGPRLRRRAA